MKSRRVVSSAVAGACALALVPTAALAADAMPDLVADPPVERALEVRDGRLLLRFDSYIRNTGPGAIEIRGGLPQDGVLTGLRQRIYDTDGSSWRDVPSNAIVRYENHVDHSHFHLRAAARYSLWTENRVWEVIASEKAGFCLADSFNTEPGKGPMFPAYTMTCSAGNPQPQEVVMGVSPGWRDDYPARLAYQWLDVSSLRPGRYRLAADVDPDSLLLESNEANPVAFQDALSIVPGYTPRPQSHRGVNPFAPTRLRLGADRWERPGGGGLGPASFTLTRRPRCGHLSGAPPLLTYHPARGCQGTLDFEFSARDSSSRFPISAPTAPATLTLGSRRALAKPSVSRRGRRVAVRTRSLYAGVVGAALVHRGRRVGACTVRAAGGRNAACAFYMRRRMTVRGMLLRTSLRIGGRIVVTRQDRIR